MISVEKFFANADEYFRNASKVVGVAIVEDFRDNITKRQGMLVGGSLREFAPRTYEVRRSKGKKQLQDTGIMLNSIRVISSSPTSVKVGISNPSVRKYAQVHNYGGEIPVTLQMKKFFWSQYYKNMGGVTMSIKTRQHATKASSEKNADALFWQRMALKRVGSKIKIKPRQFMGKTPEVIAVGQRALVQYAHQMLFR